MLYKYIVLSLYIHIFTCTYRGTHTKAYMFNLYTRGMATTRRRSLVGGAEERLLLEAEPMYTHKKKTFGKTDIYKSKKKGIRAHKASSKASRLFLTK